MKITKLFLALFLLSLAASAGFADDKENDESKVAPNRPWMGTQADLNKDGAVSAEEAKQSEDIWKQEKYQERRQEKLNMKKENEERRIALEARKAEEDKKPKKEEAPQIIQDNAPPAKTMKPKEAPDSGRVLRRDLKNSEAVITNTPETNSNVTPPKVTLNDNPQGGGIVESLE